MNYYALIYYVVDDYVTRRTQYREEHLRLANEAALRGELVLGGAFTDPADRSMLIFTAAAPSTVEEFVKNDPYVINGLVVRYEIRPWNVVVGSKKNS
ncbi:MAG: YciI-like protein [Bacteroidota bacterium]